MSNKVFIEESFEKPAKKFAKRYPSFPSDLLHLIEDLEVNALLGSSLGRGLRKIRLAIKSKRRGKSGGVRVISFVYLIKNSVHLLFVYDKSDADTIPDEELRALLAEFMRLRNE